MPLKKQVVKMLAKQSARTFKYLNDGSLLKVVKASDFISGGSFCLFERPEFNPNEPEKVETYN